MKLYVENGEVFFDYKGTDTQSGKDMRGAAARRFLLATTCEWTKTAVQQVVKMQYEPYSWASEYGQAKQLESYLKSCLTNARINGIEITEDFESLCVSTAKRCKELYEIEEAKELKRKAKEKWQRLCASGCGSCPNKVRCNDDIVCRASGDLLDEKNKPGIVRGQYVLFNYVAFPSVNCPYKVQENGG